MKKMQTKLQRSRKCEISDAEIGLVNGGSIDDIDSSAKESTMNVFHVVCSGCGNTLAAVSHMGGPSASSMKVFCNNCSKWQTATEVPAENAL